MSNYANTKAIIAENIYTNHEGKVTAEMVKTAINEVVDTLIAGGYLYAGVAKLTPTQTNPGSPDANVFYIATEPGTYTNFVGAGGSLVVAEGEVAIFKFNGTWSKEVTGIPLVSVSQNTPTGTTHTRISVGGNNYDVASVDDFSQLGQNVDSNTCELFGLPGATSRNGRIKDDGTGFDNIADGKYTHTAIRVSDGDSISFSSDNTSATYIFASDYAEPSPLLPSGSITPVGSLVTYSATNRITAPVGANYLILTLKRNNVDVSLTDFTINGSLYDKSIRDNAVTLSTQVSTIGQNLNNVDKKYEIRGCSEKLFSGEITYADLPKYEGRINAGTGKWYQINSNNKHFVIAVETGDIIQYTGLNNVVFIIGEYTYPVNNASANLLQIPSSGTPITAQSGAQYLVVDCLNSGADVTPSKLLINGVDYSTPFNTATKYLNGSMSDISDEAFEKQMVCLHHDNFYREATPTDAWDITSNYRTPLNDIINIPYTFINSQNSPSIDDGFRIVQTGGGQVLANDRSVSLSYGVRGIPSFAYVKDEAVIELSYPAYGKRCSLAFNIIDGKNYETITWIRKSSAESTDNELTILYYKYVNNSRTAAYLYTGDVVGNCVKVQTRGSGLNLWIDNLIINEFAGDNNRIERINSLVLDFSKGIGIHIEKNADCELKFINVFDCQERYDVDVNRQVDILHTTDADDRIKTSENGIMNVHGSGHYSLTNDIINASFASQRFELIKSEVSSDSLSKRIEYSQTALKRRNNLRRYKAAFDIYLPDSESEYYANDAGVVTYDGNQELDHEILFQMHDLYPEGTEIAPNVALRTVYVDGAEWFGLEIRGSYKGGNTLVGYIEQNIVNTMVLAKRGEWHHFDIYVKEGYIPEHNPLILVRHNGKLVLRNTSINTYNRALGPYGRYGIYKSLWGSDEVKGQCDYNERILYIDNFTLKI